MTRPGYSQNDLPKAWQTFVTAEPELASMLRRSAAEIRVSGNGELTKFSLMMGDKKKPTSKFLIVSNPNHVMGTATFQDVSGALIVSEKSEKGYGKEVKRKAESSED